MIKAVIFDHDGVIADTEPLHYLADNIVLSRFGLSVSPEQNDELVGVPTRKSWELFREMFKLQESVGWLVQEKTGVVLGLIEKQGVKPSEGLLQLLEGLKGNNYRLAIASGQYRKIIDAVIAKLGISSYFDAIVSCEDTAKEKPDPDIFLIAAKMLQVRPGECLVIEDSKTGIAAAKAAGMKCVALQTPSTASHDVSMADKVISSLKELHASEIAVS